MCEHRKPALTKVLAKLATLGPAARAKVAAKLGVAAPPSLKAAIIAARTAAPTVASTYSDAATRTDVLRQKLSEGRVAPTAVPMPEPTEKVAPPPPMYPKGSK